MNLNFIPTDSLYKFLALIGLFAGIFNFYYSAEETHKLNEEMVRLIWQMRAITKDIQADLIQLGVADSLVNQIKELKKDPSTWPERGKLLKQMQAVVQQVKANDRIQSNAVDELFMNEELYELKERKSKFFQNALYIGSFFAALMSVYGFQQWAKIQKRQDQLLFKTNAPQLRRYGQRFRRK